jgi:hypothetical protein
MTTTTVPREIDPQGPPSGRAFSRLQRLTGSAWKRAKGLVHSPRVRIPPRISLLTGSVLVLLTLYLPTVIDSCGSPRLGAELASGEDHIQWPSIALSVVGKGRPFYLFCLALAAFTLLLLFASAVRRDPIRKHNLLTWLAAISGSAALVSTTDLYPVAVAFLPYFRDLEGIRAQAVGFLFLLFPIACLRREFWTRKGAILWSLMVIDMLLVLWLSSFLVDRFYPQFELDNNLAALLISPISLVPLGLWFRYVLLESGPSRLWPNVGRRLAILYSVTLAFDLLCVVLLRFWGLIAFFLGAHLIFYGYWQLRHEAFLRAAVSNVESCDTCETVTPSVAA